MLISFSTKLHSDATLVGVANWVTANLRNKPAVRYWCFNKCDIPNTTV